MKIFKDEGGQMILLACLSIVLSIVLIGEYEYATLDTGQESINRENMDAYYYYKEIKARYIGVYKDPYLDLSQPNNITIFENDLKKLALLHGYSLDFKRNGTKATIMFRDKELSIKEEIGS